MDRKDYNGWTNYETWNVNLWYDDFFTEDAQRFYDEAEAETYQTREQAATCALADYIQETVEESQPEVTGVFADLIGAALSEVNWYEIAEHYIDEVEKTDDETETDDELIEA